MVPPVSGADALNVSGLTKSFGGGVVVDAVDLVVGAGEIHALLGENGSGKSTIIKVLSGFHEPDAGEVKVGGESLPFGSPADAYRLGARFVHQELGLIDSSSVLDNLAIGAGFSTTWGTIRRRKCEATAMAALERVGLDLKLDTDVGRLSPALKTGVAIARALRDDSVSPVRLLILDEPTATLPVTEVDKLMGTVKQVAAGGVGVLYVTHRLDEVFDLAGNVTVLRDGRVVANRRTAELDKPGLIRLLVGDEFATAEAAAAPLARHALSPALTAKGVAAERVHEVDVEIAAGQITGVAGITGSGREAFLGALFGAIPRSGEVRLGDGTVLPPHRPDASIARGVAFLPADRKSSGGIMSLSACENISLSDLRPFRRLATLRRRPEREEARRWFDALGVQPRSSIDMVLEAFSGGNQQKVLFGKWLRRDPSVFLLDEPTQGVDVGAKATLHAELVGAARRGAAVVVSSSDVDELAAICQRVLIFRDGRIVAELEDDEVSAKAITRECLSSEREPAHHEH